MAYADLVERVQKLDQLLQTLAENAGMADSDYQLNLSHSCEVRLHTYKTIADTFLAIFPEYNDQYARCYTRKRDTLRP